MVVSEPEPVEEPDALSLRLDGVQSNSCSGENEGSIFYRCSWWGISYEFQWTNEVGEIVGDSARINNIPAGAYTIVVTDVIIAWIASLKFKW